MTHIRCNENAISKVKMWNCNVSFWVLYSRSIFAHLNVKNCSMLGIVTYDSSYEVRSGALQYPVICTKCTQWLKTIKNELGIYLLENDHFAENKSYLSTTPCFSSSLFENWQKLLENQNLACLWLKLNFENKNQSQNRKNAYYD